MNELYKVSNVEEQMLYTMQQLPDMLVQTFAQQASEKPPAEFTEILARATFIAMKEALIESGVLMEAFVLAQAEFYSVAEIQELIESSTSRRLVRNFDAAPYVGPKLQQLMMPALINFKICMAKLSWKKPRNFAAKTANQNFAQFLDSCLDCNCQIGNAMTMQSEEGRGV